MHKFSPEKAAGLENSERRALIPPDRTLVRFGLKEGMVLADIGAGTGFFSRAGAAIVGPSGRVYAAEMSEQMVAYFRSQGVPPNVELKHSDEYETHVPDAVADLTLLAFVAHENVDKQRLLNEAFRITKPGGAVAIVEWKKQDEPKGPPKEERLAQEDLLKELQGRRVTEQGDLNRSHYFVLIRR